MKKLLILFFIILLKSQKTIALTQAEKYSIEAFYIQFGIQNNVSIFMNKAKMRVNPKIIEQINFSGPFVMVLINQRLEFMYEF